MGIAQGMGPTLFPLRNHVLPFRFCGNVAALIDLLNSQPEADFLLLVEGIFNFLKSRISFK